MLARRFFAAVSAAIALETGAAPARAVAGQVVDAAPAAGETVGSMLRFAGMTLHERRGRVVVEEVLPGSAAGRAGVLPFDVLLVVDDVALVDLQPLGLDAVRRVLQRSGGEEVRFVIGRGAGTFTVRIAAAAAAPPAPAPSKPRSEPVRAGDPAPGFTGVDIRGREVSLAGLRGSPVLIDFWASWCPPCRPNVLILRRIAAAHADRLRVVGVGLDDDRKAWEAFVYNQHLPGLQIRDGRAGPVAAAYGVAAAGIPFAVLVDGAGRVVAAGASVADLEGDIDRMAGPSEAGR